MKNIVLIGMPGCGKSTAAELLARRLGRPWFDSDLEIERSEGMNIYRIFEEYGEAYFRRKELECIWRLSEERGAVISLGGGAVTGDRGLIKKNAAVVYIEREIEDIISTLETENRPLLKNGPASLHKLYVLRRPLYESTGDVTVKNDGTPEELIEKIMEALA